MVISASRLHPLQQAWSMHCSDCQDACRRSDIVGITSVAVFFAGLSRAARSQMVTSGKACSELPSTMMRCVPTISLIRMPVSEKRQFQPRDRLEAGTIRRHQVARSVGVIVDLEVLLTANFCVNIGSTTYLFNMLYINCREKTRHLAKHSPDLEAIGRCKNDDRRNYPATTSQAHRSIAAHGVTAST